MTDSLSPKIDNSESVLKYCGSTGQNFAISCELITNVIPADTVYPCPFAEKWVIGMIAYQQSVLALIDPDLYVEDIYPNHVLNKLEAQQKQQVSLDGKALICKKGEIEFAILCYDIKLINAQRDELVANSNDDLDDVTNYKTFGDEILFSPNFFNFTENMSWLKNQLSGQDEQLDDEIADLASEKDEDQSNFDSGNIVIADAKKNIQMLQIDREHHSFLVDRNLIQRVENIHSFLPCPPGLPPWVKYLIQEQNVVIPIIDFCEIDLSLKLKKSENRYQETTIIILQYEQKLLGIEIEKCRLVDCTEIIDDHEYEKIGFVNGTQCSIIDVAQLYERLNDSYVFPVIQPHRETDTASFIIIKIGHAKCAVLLNDALSMLDSSNLVALDKTGISDINQLDLEFSGVIPVKGDHSVPVFNIAAQIDLDLMAQDFEFSRVIIVGDTIEKSCGYLINDILGLIHQPVEKFIKIDSKFKVLLGILQLDNNEIAIVLNKSIS